MNRATLFNLIASSTIASASFFAAAPSAQAVPINGRYFEDPRCDVLPNQQLSDELGEFTVFPPNESIRSTPFPTTITVCVPNDGLANDWLVEIQNLSGVPWHNLYFVCDHGATVGNADGSVDDANLAPGLLSDAFKIDGTVTGGINNNLMFESMIVDEIFQPNEIWRFAVSNFNTIAAANPMPLFITPGIFSGSSMIGLTQGNASILANPIPEPATIGSIGALVASQLMRRRPRH